jgi:AraC-like DNA-binding protein/mannose-6-phosphate isomerase-like protein (cupin superfamily)
MPQPTSHAPLPRRDTQVHAHLRVREWVHDGEPVDSTTSTHPWVELTWLERGEVVYRIEGLDEVRVRAGQAIVVPAGVVHETLRVGPLEGTALCIGREMLDAIADAMGPDTRARRLTAGLAASSPNLLPLGRVLRAEARASSPGSLLAADAVGEALVVELLRRAPSRIATGATRDARVNIAVDRIHASYADPLTVDDLARSAGMSRFHFSRLFRDQVGDAPYRYLLRVRVRRAAELLRRGRHDVTEAAFTVGFHDLGRFGRMFRREIGCRPSELRRARPDPIHGHGACGANPSRRLTRSKTTMLD